MTAILEDAKELVVDKWGTLNTAASPAKLPDGHSPNNLNVWMDEKPGSVLTANGYIKLGEIPSGNPPTLLLNYFKTSDGSSQLIVSDNATIWYTTDYVNYTSIKTGLSQSFQLRAKVIRDKVWFTNGSDDVATWDGATYTELDGTGGTPDVPCGKYIEYHDERVWIYGIASDLSACRFSALTDAAGTEITPENASAWPTDNEIQISEGDADQGTGIFLYRGYLYCSKQYSIWRIVGYDEYTYTRVKTRSSTGTRFQESIQIKDNLVNFIGVDGLYVFDGEESKRISDIIDPASAEAGVFAFRNLQQPLLNNKFWNVSETEDFDNVAVPTNLSLANDEIRLMPADDSQADFQAGAVLTNIDTTTTPGSIGLRRNTSGTTNTPEEIAQNQTVQAKLLAGIVGPLIGSPGDLTDGAGASVFGHTSPGTLNILVNLSRTEYVTRVRLARALGSGSHTYGVYVNTGARADLSTFDSNSLPASFINVALATIVVTGTSQDIEISFSALLASQVFIYTTSSVGSGNGEPIYFGSVNVFPSGYPTTGEFISKTIDYGAVPESFGRLAASAAAGNSVGTTHANVAFYTQSSVDGNTWDSAVAVGYQGGLIASTLRRYLRWRVSFTSDTADTFIIDKVYVGSTYISEIHDTGGNILQWAALQVERSAAGQTINAYFRAGTSSGAVSAASWTAIVPGAVPNTAITNTFIQIRLELSTGDANFAPAVQGFTVNWVVSASAGAAILQNVASFIWLNRYWLAAATLGADENDIVIVLGKSTAGSPWHKRDFKLLSFCRFQDIFIAGSSEDGSLYRLEYGFSKNGEAMDSYYETRDFSIDNFQMKGRELLMTCDRSGPYDLSVGWSTDGGLTWTERTIGLTRDDGASLSFTKKLNINFMSDAVRFRVRTNAADQPFSVDELRSYYRQVVQRGGLVS